MNKTVPVITRVAPALKKKLQALAKTTKRSEAFLAREAIETFVEHNAWQVATIRRRLDETLAGQPSVPHEEVVRWLDSKWTERPLPMPKPRR